MSPIRRLDHHTTKKNAAPAMKQESGTMNTASNSGTADQSNVDAVDCIRNPLNIKDIADIGVGYISSIKSTTIESVQSLDDYLTDIKSGKYKTAVEGYRALIKDKMPVELKSNAVRHYKASVPCCVPHSNCTTAHIDNNLPQNGIMQVDVDRPSLGNLYVTDEQITAAFDACPYIFAYHRSIGGDGYVGYAYTDDPIDKAFWIVATDIQSRGLYVDLSKGGGTGDRRFMSYDTDLVIKEQFTPVKAVAGITQNSIVRDYTWHKPSSKQLVKDAEKAFANWVNKNGGFDWTSSGPASPAGLFASAVSRHLHNLSLDDLIQLADWCVFLYNDELIVEEELATWKQYLDRYGKYDDNSIAGKPAAGHSQANGSRVKLTRFEDIEDRKPDWFMFNKIPANDITIISGEGGGGKTYFTCHMAAHVTNGTPWADGSPCEQGAVIFFPPEGQQSALKRRLIANGVDISKCRLLEGKMSYDAHTGTYGVDVISLADAAWISEAIDEVERETGVPVKMVVVDPVGNFTGRSDSYKDTEVRQILAPLQRLADEKKVTFILVAHHNKAEHSSAQKKVMGSVAWANIARAHWVISVDKTDKDLRYFAPSKYNDCKNPTAIAYRIVSDEGQWEGEVRVESMDIAKTATDLMLEQKQSGQLGRPLVKRDEAKDWLEDFLSSGMKPSKEIYKAASDAGISSSTLDRAKKELRIMTQRVGFGKEGQSYWMPLLSKEELVQRQSVAG